jgi:hypothetical protein
MSFYVASSEELARPQTSPVKFNSFQSTPNLQSRTRVTPLSHGVFDWKGVHTSTYSAYQRRRTKKLLASTTSQQTTTQKYLPNLRKPCVLGTWRKHLDDDKLEDIDERIATAMNQLSTVLGHKRGCSCSYCAHITNTEEGTAITGCVSKAHARQKLAIQKHTCVRDAGVQTEGHIKSKWNILMGLGSRGQLGSWRKFELPSFAAAAAASTVRIYMLPRFMRTRTHEHSSQYATLPSL